MLQKIAPAFMVFINWFNGICAVVCGLAMMGGLFDGVMPLSIFDPFPLHDVFFTSLFWPGLALLLVNGVANLAACVCRIRRLNDRWIVCNLVAALLLIGWTVTEMILIPNGLTVFYLIIGVLQLAATIYLLRTPSE